MDRLNGWNLKRKLLAGIATIAVCSTLADAGTRMIPPPPPRHNGDETLDGIQQESEWGAPPAQDRWGALEDEEGREIDFNRGTLSQRLADRPRYEATREYRGPNRAPAGLEVKQTGKGSGGEGWKSTTVDDTRRISKEAVDSNGQRPVLNRVSRTEAARQDAEAEKFVTDVQDPIARRKGMQEVSIIAGDLGFFPKTIFVSRDVPVRLFVTGTSKGSLCIMMDSFNVKKQIRSNKIEEITFVPNQPGTYRYYCPVNGSEGTMVVKELSTAVAGEM